MKKGLLALLTGMFVSQPAQAEPLTKEGFWLWFKDNKAFIQQYDTNTEEVMDSVELMIKQIHPDLWFEIGQAEDDQYEFIISGGGLKSAIPQVVDLYKAAPQIDGWRVIAFKPRHAIKATEYKGIEFKIEDFMYASNYYDDLTDVTVYIKGFTEKNEETHGMAGFLFLDSVLGEYDVMTKLGNIRFEPMPGNPQALGLKPLPELAAEVDARG